jgi:hypothetical protein
VRPLTKQSNRHVLAVVACALLGTIKSTYLVGQMIPPRKNATRSQRISTPIQYHTTVLINVAQERGVLRGDVQPATINRAARPKPLTPQEVH